MSVLSRGGLIALILALTSLNLTGCSTNPVTGESEFSLVSPAQEISIGEQQYLPSRQSQGGDYQVDRELSEYVNRVGQRLAAVSDSDLPYEFSVLNNGVPNAWALPGGKIAINRGLLVELGSEAELAAVLGHEIVHAAARHGAQSVTRGTLLQGALVVGMIASADSEYSNLIVGGAQLGAQLISQSYGRDAEREADYYGIRYMLDAGYDPAAAVALQETFVRLSEGRSQAGWLEGLFASHPPHRSVWRTTADWFRSCCRKPRDATWKPAASATRKPSPS
ncbi:M48 family metalloprotease [Kineobactrum salinum]|uniref:M48 family metalloprotease n=1 Tax=Kineobactrum salinum TaxID=2708301 RepID=UPI001E31A490|nr:M48 family metalloprotease [Kineobactrum salinum]